jgi:outer membrane protein assembly factor BamB
MNLRAMALVSALMLVASAQAQTIPSSPRKNNADQNTFPSWERDVDPSELRPLPTGAPGRFEPRWTVDLTGTATGVASLPGGIACAALAEGGLRFVGSDGKVLREDDAGAAVVGPPVSCGPRVVVPLADRFLAADASGILWRTERGASPVGGMDGNDDLVVVAREGGVIEALDGTTGRLLWSAALGDAVTAGPALAPDLVLAGAGGDVVALDVATGAQVFRTALGESVTAVGAQQGGILAAGMGRGDRSPTPGPFIAGIDLRGTRRPERANWKLRVGGRCDAGPFVLGEAIAFACDDGYVRALSRRKGLEAWRTDLPVRARHVPVRVGGRLDFILERTGHAVALSAENGAVLGWMTLPDADETFVGPAARAGDVTVAATTLARLVGLGWEWIKEEDDKKGSAPSPNWQPRAAGSGRSVTR